MKELLGRNKGITLIALIITIIVMLILAGVALNTLTGRGSIIENANSTVGKYNNSVEQEQVELNEISSYLDEKVNKAKGVTATDIANDTSYYGATVNYEDAKGDPNVKWQIFYVSTADEESDGKSHIYLIASDYIAYDYCPTSAKYTIFKNSTYRLSMDNVYQDYTGSASITDARIKKWIQKYLDVAPSSENINIRAVAYILDNSIWDGYYGNSTYAEYAIGGSTVEMLMKSYNKKYNTTDYQTQANTTGYQISKDGGSNWAAYYNGMLSTSDSLYVITSTSDAYGYWLGSPSAIDGGRVMYVYYHGGVGNYYFYDGSIRLPSASLSKI